MLSRTQQELARRQGRPASLLEIGQMLARIDATGNKDETAKPRHSTELGSSTRPDVDGKAKTGTSKKSRRAKPTPTGKSKTCTKCKLPKPLDRFPPHPDTRDGRAAWCKDCRAVLRKRRNQTNMVARLKHHFAARMTQQLKDNGVSADEMPPLVLEMESYLGYKMSDLVKVLDVDIQEREGISLREAFDDGYHVDHITPLSKFPFGEIGDKNFRRCWAQDNLRAIPAADNLKKGSVDIFEDES